MAPSTQTHDFYVLNVEPLTLQTGERLSDALEQTLLPKAHAVALDTTQTEGKWRLQAYFTSRKDSETIWRLLEAVGFGKLMHSEPLTVEGRDWVKEGLKSLQPIQAGRFYVHGSHDAPSPRESDISIKIDANQAFGTGHHETTRSCLTMIDRLSKKHRFCNALDIGTGTGILAMAVARQLKIPVTASDIDPLAIQVARENIRDNSVAPFIRSRTAVGIKHPDLRAGGPYSLILANILAKPLAGLAQSLRTVSKPGTIIVLSGLLSKQTPFVRVAYQQAGFTEISRIDDGEWTTLAMQYL